VKELAAGGHHTLLLTREGAVYGWGSNAHGQLGLQNEDTAQVRQVYTTALVLQQGGSNKTGFSTPIGAEWEPVEAVGQQALRRVSLAAD
jgi:alpha-tubulin suppressor-like RCC1 family protein